MSDRLRQVSFYHPETGLFHGSIVTGSEKAIELNTPPGHVAIDGAFDPGRHRVDLATRQVVPHTPPRDPALDAAHAAATAAARIADLERQQHRAVREALLALGTGGRLAEIEAEISALRSTLA
jgi:hypothetical protein